MKTSVIAIDGPSYVGKSSISRALAELTGFIFINTGHMYRAVAHRCLVEGVLAENEADVLRLARGMKIEFKKNGRDCLTVVDGRDMTDGLNAPEVVLTASRIAKLPALRDVLTAQQRGYARQQTIIMEGRDIGSEVFPDAEWKFFVTASLEIRAYRMWKMMDEKERQAMPDSRVLIPKIQELDENDMKRKIAPLKKAEDAIVYDNTDSPTAMQDARVLNGYFLQKTKAVR